MKLPSANMLPFTMNDMAEKSGLPTKTAITIRADVESPSLGE